MDAMASQITSVSIVYSSVCSGADHRKHLSSVSLAFGIVRGIHRGRLIPRTNGQWRGKCFHLMTSWLMSISFVSGKCLQHVNPSLLWTSSLAGTTWRLLLHDRRSEFRRGFVGCGRATIPAVCGGAQGHGFRFRDWLHTGQHRRSVTVEHIGWIAWTVMSEGGKVGKATKTKQNNSKACVTALVRCHCGPFF